jgi:hypothetical protein
MYPSIYMRACVCVSTLHACTYSIHLSVHVRIARRHVCVHECATGMDRLCAHALAGSCCGLGLDPESLSRASPCPSAWTACGFGAQTFASASAFNANIGAWNTARVTTLSMVCAAFSAPGGATAGGTRSAGRGGGSGRCLRRSRRCARVCERRRVRTCMRGCPRARVWLRVAKTAFTYEWIFMYICIYIGMYALYVPI